VNITKVVLEADSSSIKAATKDLNALQGSGEKAQGAMSGLTKATNETTSTVESAGRAIKIAAGALAAIGLGVGIREMISYTDRWSDLNSRLRNATGSFEDADDALAQISATARRTYSSIESTAQAFLQNNLVLKELGYTTSQQLNLMDSLNNSLVISGAKGQAAELVFGAVGRAMAQGSLKGQEFNLIMNYSSRTIEALANGLGVSVLQLREMSQQGQLTADVIYKALTSQMMQLRKEAEEMPATIGDGLLLMKNAMFEYVGVMDQAAGASAGVANVLVSIADNFEHLAAAVGIISVAMGGQYAAALAASITASSVKRAALVAETAAEVARTTATLAGTAADLAAAQAAAAKTPGFYLNASAKAALTQAEVAHTAATAANTTAQGAHAAAIGRTTLAATGLRNILMTLAGPGAILAVAAAGMYVLVQRQKELAETSWAVAQRFDDVRSSLGQLNKNELAASIKSESELIKQLKEKQRTLQVLFNTQGMYEDELRVINLRVIEAESNHGLLVRQLERVQEGFGTAGAAANSAEAYLYSLENGFETLNVDILTAHEYLRLMTGSTKVANTAVQDFVRSMDAAAYSSKNTESAYVELMGITDQVTVRTTRLTAEQRNASLVNVDAQDSIDGIVEKMGKQKTASAELTQVTAQMRNDISSAFADMMMNGGNAFDNIAKAFERMVYKMVADWAASGVMNVLSKLAGGAGGHTSTLGNIISGAGTSSIGSAVGSIIGGGSAAAAGAAVGGTAGVSTVFAAGAPTAAGLTSSAIGTTAATTSAGSSGFLAAAAAPVAVFAAIAGGLMIGAKQNEKQREELKQEWLAAEASLAGMGINVNEIYSESAVRNMLEAAPEFAGLPGVDAAALSQGLISGAVRQFLFDPSSYQQMDGSNANGLDYVPFDGYRSTLHQGEAVITARGNDALGMMASALTEMRTIMAAVAQHTAKSARQLERWDFGGLPEERAFA
jgi:tape measure domain-containing protein